jgi:hypothetical protein
VISIQEGKDVRKTLGTIFLSLALTVCSALAFGQAQPNSGGSNPNSYTCGGTTCMTPDASWVPLETDGSLQNNTSQLVRAVNGAKLFFGSKSADITLGTGGTTTDSSTNLLPANSIILQVTGTVSTTISGGTCSGWQLGDPTTAGRFTASDTTLTAGESKVGGVHLTTGIASATTGMFQAADAKVRITCATGAPGAGKIRVTVFYLQAVPPLI